MINNITPKSKDIHICTKREKQTGKIKSQVKKERYNKMANQMLRRAQIYTTAEVEP